MHLVFTLSLLSAAISFSARAQTVAVSVPGVLPEPVASTEPFFLPEPIDEVPHATVLQGNFRVTAWDEDSARQIAEGAERWLQKHFRDWLKRPAPALLQPAAVEATLSPNKAGETSFVFLQGQPTAFISKVTAPDLKRLIDTVVAHEVLHMVMALHFRRGLPRWADEGMSTSVEPKFERAMSRYHLANFLMTSRGLPLNKMLPLYDYPEDILPLYAQGHSVVEFLLEKNPKNGRAAFLVFLGEAMRTGDWSAALRKHYGFGNTGELQTAWLADFKKKMNLR